MNHHTIACDGCGGRHVILVIARDFKPSHRAPILRLQPFCAVKFNFDRIAPYAILYIAENGAKWRKLPTSLGHWHTIYTRMRAWTKNGVLARVFEALQQEQLIHFKIEVGSLDSTSIKVHPDGTGALKKTGRKPSDVLGEDSRPRFIWLPAMSGQHYVSASRRANAPTAPRGASS